MVLVLIFLFGFFYFYSVVHGDDKVHYSVGFFFVCWESLGRVFWTKSGDSFVSKNPKEVCFSHFLGQNLGCAHTTCVKDWPSTEPSIKRCTCVNKRKNSGSRWTWVNNIARTQTGWVRWRQDVELRTSGRQRALGPQWPTVEQPSQDEKEVLLGQNSSLFPSPTHLSHITNITLSRIKRERLYFIKEEYSFVHWSSSLLLTMFSLIFVLCIYMWLYNTCFNIQSNCLVGWECRIHRLLLCKWSKTPPTSVLDMTLNNLMVSFQ